MSPCSCQWSLWQSMVITKNVTFVTGGMSKNVLLYIRQNSGINHHEPLLIYHVQILTLCHKRLPLQSGESQSLCCGRTFGDDNFNSTIMSIFWSYCKHHNLEFYIYVDFRILLVCCSWDASRALFTYNQYNI